MSYVVFYSTVRDHSHIMESRVSNRVRMTGVALVVSISDRVNVAYSRPSPVSPYFLQIYTS